MSENLDRVPMDAILCKRQINNGALMSIGARSFKAFSDALVFTANIHPRKANGQRFGSARVMTVIITLTPMDTYRVQVYFDKKVQGRPTRVTHFDVSDLYQDNLSAVMLSLDNGDEERWAL